MTRVRSWMAGLALAALAGVAQAEEAVVTASSTPMPAADTSTAAQIDQFIRSAPTPSLEPDGVDGITTGERKMHGEVSVGVGTGGYRSFSALSVIPLGETGTLAIAVSQSRNNPYAYYGDYGGYGRGGYGRGYGEGDRQSIGLSFSSQGDAPRCSKRMDRGPAWHRLDDGPGERACSNDAVDLAR
ncbi:hypothetical protein BH11PSE1_BH11PSE1_04230 [soil metagenome]